LPFEKKKSRLLTGISIVEIYWYTLSTKAIPALRKIIAKIKVTVCFVVCHSVNKYKNASCCKKFILSLFMMAKRSVTNGER
jgi:hypothetical protein